MVKIPLEDPVIARLLINPMGAKNMTKIIANKKLKMSAHPLNPLLGSNNSTESSSGLRPSILEPGGGLDSDCVSLIAILLFDTN